MANFISPEDYAQLLRESRDTDRFGQGMLQRPTHWSQALAGALGMGLGGYQAGQARDRNQATVQDANQQLAQLLQGGGNLEAAMANPRSADAARQYQMQAPARARAAASASREAARFDRERSQWGMQDKVNQLKMRQLEGQLAKQNQSREMERAILQRFGIGGEQPQQAGPPSGTPNRFNFTGAAPQPSGMTAQFDKLAPSQQTQVLAALQRKDYGEAARIMGSATRLKDLGIDPDSPEGQAFLLTGKLPAAAFKAMQASQKRKESGGNIAAGLRDVLRRAEDANKAGSLESSIGPFQGSEPTSLLGAVPINIARAWGEVTNLLGGGEMSPTEVRSNVQGATEAIAAAIKPLIRGPGEGPWTDADQARLVSVVGNLPQARDLKEFKRRLNAVRDRVQANFGLEIPFDAEQDAAPTQGIPTRAIEKLRQDPSLSAAFDEKYGQGAAARVLNGR